MSRCGRGSQGSNPLDEWFDRSGVGYQPGGCGVRRSEQPEITIDGQPGRIWEECPGQVEATVVAGGRLYLFTLYLEASDVRAVFDAYALHDRSAPGGNGQPSAVIERVMQAAAACGPASRVLRPRVLRRRFRASPTASRTR